MLSATLRLSYLIYGKFKWLGCFSRKEIKFTNYTFNSENSLSFTIRLSFSGLLKLQI